MAANLIVVGFAGIAAVILLILARAACGVGWSGTTSVRSGGQRCCQLQHAGLIPRPPRQLDPERQTADLVRALVGFPAGRCLTICVR